MLLPRYESTCRGFARRSSQDVLTTRSPGYVIHVDPDALDLHRFERLVEEGEACWLAVCAADAATRLRDALALWRGPVLGDFAYESFAQAAIARFEEIRLAALELRIDADLVLGRHDELVGSSKRSSTSIRSASACGST